MTPPKVLVIGDIMRDIVVRPSGPIRPATDQRASIAIGPGGSGANQAAWLAHCGVPVRLLACVGAADRPAEEDRLRRAGVEPALVGHPGLPTGRLIALIDPGGERSFLTDRGANDGLHPAALPAGLLGGVGHLHLSGYALVGEATRAAALHLLGAARAAGLPISFDPGSAGFVEDMGAGELFAGLGDAQLCAANAAEAESLTGETDPERQITALTGHFDLVVLKRGAEGALAGHRDGWRWRAAAPAVAVVDTIGAGDAFLAGFLAGVLTGVSVRTSLERAVALGSVAVGIAGGLPEPAVMASAAKGFSGEAG